MIMYSFLSMEQQKTSNEQNKLIAQGNKLVEGKYNYSLWELRVFIEMVQSVERADKEFKPVRIYLKDLIKQYGTNSNDDYRKITLSAIRLIRKAVKIEYVTDTGEERIFHSPLVIGVDTPKRIDDGFDKYIELQFPEKIRPLLLDLKKNYLLYDKKNILNLKSKFSVRIYQMLKSQEREKKDFVVVEYEVAKLRSILLVDDDGNPTNQYTRYSQFEKRVILTAQKELQEHTDIAFSFDKIKQGRSIHSIRFFLRKNRKVKLSKSKNQLPGQLEIDFDTEAPNFADPIHSNKAYQMLIDKKISQDQAYNLVNNFDTQFILDTIKKCDKENEKMPKKNLAGFIVDSIKKERYQQDIQAEQEAKEQKKNEVQEKKKKELHHQLIKQHFDQFEQKKKQKVEQIKKGLSEKETAEIITATREKYPFSNSKNNAEIIESMFFGFVVSERYQDTPQLQKIDYDFYYWMEQVHNAKVIKNKQTDMFELLS